MARRFCTALGPLQKLPRATTPAQLQGRAVRVSYVVPVSFKMQ